MQRRGRKANTAREAAILLSRELTRQTIVDLGASFDGVGGSAISETVRRAREREKAEPAFRGGWPSCGEN